MSPQEGGLMKYVLYDCVYVLLLMAEILHQFIGSLSHYL